MLINGIERGISPNANLHGANLHGANLHGANLHGANLRGANLHGADLREANLHGADLYGANLYAANLYGANLYAADLREANLYGANLCVAGLRGANLHGANLCVAYLHGADLCGANLREANLHWANLHGAKNIPPLAAAQTTIVGEGDLVGYKKLADGSICKLKIPADAERSNATGRKCRCSYAIVLEGGGVSSYDRAFEYVVGETVRPTRPFDKNRWEECASGIHFFLTREEAGEAP